MFVPSDALLLIIWLAMFIFSSGLIIGCFIGRKQVKNEKTSVIGNGMRICEKCMKKADS